MFECFHCLHKAVIWNSDFDAEEYGYEEPGIVHVCHCTHCGAEITYVILENQNEDDLEEVETEDKKNED